MNEHIFGVLEVNAVCVGAVAWRWDAHVMNQNSHAIVKFEVELGAVSNCNARDRHIETPIKPQSLCKKHN